MEYKWIARDNDGELWQYSSKPYKGRKQWHCSKGSVESLQELPLFKDVEWTDGEALKVEYYEAQIKNIDDVSEPGNMVDKPSHYIGINGLEVEEVLRNFVPRYKNGYQAHRAASALEYILRSPLKNKREDIKKAIKNLEQLLEVDE